MIIEEEKEEVAYFEVTIYSDKTAKIELEDNGDLAKIIAGGIINDERLLELFTEVLVYYQIKMNDKNKLE